MQIIKQFGWVYYVGETADQLDEHKCGKWMYFFGDVEFAEKICKAAVENGVEAESKHSDAPEGVSIDDTLDALSNYFLVIFHQSFELASFHAS